MVKRREETKPRKIRQFTPVETIAVSPDKLKKRRVTKKNKLFVQKLAEGLTPQQAAKEVYEPSSDGYRRVLAHRLMKNPSVRKLMYNSGIDTQKVVSTLSDALEASTTFWRKDVEYKTPNWMVRLKAAELFLRMMGMLDSHKGDGSTTPPEIKVQFIKIDEKAKQKALKEL